MNNKGQALVEFVMILPVVLVLIFLSFDFGHIYYEKTKLENTTNDALTLLENNNNYDDVVGYLSKIDKSIVVNIKYETDGYMKLTLDKDISVFTPGLNLIIGNPFNIKVDRTVKYEEIK